MSLDRLNETLEKIKQLNRKAKKAKNEKLLRQAERQLAIEESWDDHVSDTRKGCLASIGALVLVLVLFCFAIWGKI